MKNKKKKPECPACGSKNILTNKKMERFCRCCGHEWKKK